MTKEETQEKQSNVQNSDIEDDTDFEELLLRRNAKDQIDDSKWSEIQVRDVQVYSGMEYMESSEKVSPGSGKIRGTICGDVPPYDVLKDMNHNNYEEYTVESKDFKDYDGSIKYGGETYLYRERKWVIVTVESVDGTYEDQYVVTRTPKFKQDTIERVYKSIISDTNKNGSIGNPPDSNGKYLRTDKVINSTGSDMLFRSFIRLGVIGSSVLTGFFGGLLLAIISSSLAVGSIFMFSLVVLASNMQQKIYDGWYEIADLDWIDEIPEEARITDEFSKSVDIDPDLVVDQYDFIDTEAEVESYEDGTICIDAGTNKWTIKGEEGLPSDKAMEMYDSYGAIDLSELGKIPIKVSDYDDRYPLTEDLILSDDGKKVLKFTSV